MNWPRKLGLALILLGTVLLGVYLVPTVYGAAMSHLAIAQFRAQSPAHREWDSARIRAFQRSLAVKFPPPEAVLRVQRVGLEVPVLEGVDDLTLNRGAGHIPGTALPGGLGTVGIAGHRDTHFRLLRRAAKGMDVRLIDRTGTYHYRVTSTEIVTPDQVGVLDIVSSPGLALITCYPFSYVGHAPKRFVVHAVLVSAAPDEPSGAG